MNKKNYLAIFAKSFNWAGFFLPKKIYEDSSKLYAFCRVLDDIADEKTDLDSKIERFDEMRNFLKKSYDANNKETYSSNENEKIVNDVVILAKNNNIKKIILEDLVDGVASDLKKRIHMRSVKDLLIYSYRVAGTVGLMMAKILKVKSNLALTSAIDLGIAMQLTNIARDVIEDADRNRKYIDNNFNKIKETIKLADTFYNSSFRSISEIPISCRFAILVARRVYRQIGNEIIKKRDFEDYKRSGKIFVTKLGKVKETFLSIYDFILLLFLKPNNHNLDFHHINIRREINLDDRF